jgi:hypothetical protein
MVTILEPGATSLISRCRLHGAASRSNAVTLRIGMQFVEYYEFRLVLDKSGFWLHVALMAAAVTVLDSFPSSAYDLPKEISRRVFKALRKFVSDPRNTGLGRIIGCPATWSSCELTASAKPFIQPKFLDWVTRLRLVPINGMSRSFEAERLVR